MIAVEVANTLKVVDGKKQEFFKLVTLMNRETKELVYIFNKDFVDKYVENDPDHQVTKPEEKDLFYEKLENPEEEVLILGKPFTVKNLCLYPEDIMKYLIDFHKADNGVGKVILTPMSVDIGNFYHYVNHYNGFLATKNSEFEEAEAIFMTDLIDLSTLLKTGFPGMNKIFDPTLGSATRLYLALYLMSPDSSKS